ncbi:LysM peptidoglycan-binding domain-containing protein [Vibrio nitrifigilis]|uniref:LysM peptidoglycan-binding domain-containing protein n=1 Tax=Vibrio nitrifigilis TaxID=2789781 RepID=A0ABS0G9F2_9VIBR|nr:LysM peptidoglycan-binding domain-containing protein [Vibrio nitrifigilis]MBF8999032.1 LysM peptidoglycan-binding domain-containing protein [Vibrio nitrifigilis]
MTRFAELTNSEFNQVEGGLDQLSREELNALVPEGMALESFEDKLREGHLWLLQQAIKNPTLKHQMSAINSAAQELAKTSKEPKEPGVRHALPESLERVLSALKQPSSSNKSTKPHRPGYGDVTPFSRHPHSIHDVQSLADVRPDFSDTIHPLRHEYSFEVACSEQALINNVGCHFSLGKTVREPMLGNWHKSHTRFGTKFTIHTAFNEPKQLMVQVGSVPMGVTLADSVKLDEIGAVDSIRDSFIPVIPAVQTGGRLGLPTEGYYYHICNRHLVQEYKILGEGKWSFYATRSTHRALDDRQGFNRYQNAILLFWKLRGRMIKNQRLVYLKQQITREQLDNLNDQWLDQHSVVIDIPSLLKTTKESMVTANQEQWLDDYSERGDTTYFVQRQLGSSKRESWNSIAMKHGVSPKRLLELNPRYQADPASLKVGDELIVIDLEAKAMAGYNNESLPALEPKTYNRAMNAFYRYPQKLLRNTDIRALNCHSVVDDSLPIVNITSVG